MHPVEILGFIGGAIGIFIGLPQALHVRKLGHGEGVSLSAWSLMFAMYCAWAFYGIRISSPSAALSNFITLLVVAGVVIALIGDLKKSLLF